MTGTTAIRSFGRSGYCPVKRTRIFANRWYLVTFQNIERDGLTDYIGLGEGEYTVLLPGDQARKARDAHLNHCNRIQDYDGPVFRCDSSVYGGNEQITFHTSEEGAATKREEIKAAWEKWLADCRKEADRHAQIIAADKCGILPAEMRLESIAEIEALIAAQIASPAGVCKVEKVR